MEKFIRIGRWVATGLAVFCILAFVFQNTDSVTTRFLMFRIAAPRAALIVICYALGIVTGVLIMIRKKKDTHAGS